MTLIQSKISAIGFDVDGTLYHAPPHMQARVGKTLIEKAADLLDLEPEDIAQEYLRRRDEFASNTQTLNSFGLSGEKIFQEIWDEVPIEKYVKKDERLVKIIAELKKKYKIFLITNGTGKQVKRKLDHLGIDYHDFDPRIYCYDRGWLKPDPAPFLYAIETLGVKPDEIVYIGDKEGVDVEGAKAVGMQTIFVGGKSSIADASFESVYDIVTVL